MANEINASITLSVKTALGITADRSESKKINMTGEAVYHGIQDVTATAAILEYSEQALMGSTGDGAGWMFLKNLDSSQIITLGDDNGHTTHIIKLKPGEFALFRANIPIFADCVSGTAKLEVLVIET